MRYTFKDLLVKKPIDELKKEVKTHELRRTLGPTNLTTLGIGAIIGAGIFVLTGQAAAQYHSLLAFGIVCSSIIFLRKIEKNYVFKRVPIFGAAFSFIQTYNLDDNRFVCIFLI